MGSLLDIPTEIRNLSIFPPAAACSAISAKAARKSKGWSQTKLAQTAGISRARLEALENARLAEMGVKHLLRILNALDLDLRLTQLNRGRPTLEDLAAEEAL